MDKVHRLIKLLSFADLLSKVNYGGTTVVRALFLNAALLRPYKDIFADFFVLSDDVFRPHSDQNLFGTLHHHSIWTLQGIQQPAFIFLNVQVEGAEMVVLNDARDKEVVQMTEVASLGKLVSLVELQQLKHFALTNFYIAALVFFYCGKKLKPAVHTIDTERRELLDCIVAFIGIENGQQIRMPET